MRLISAYLTTNDVRDLRASLCDTIDHEHQVSCVVLNSQRLSVSSAISDFRYTLTFRHNFRSVPHTSAMSQYTARVKNGAMKKYRNDPNGSNGALCK